MTWTAAALIFATYLALVAWLGPFDRRLRGWATVAAVAAALLAGAPLPESPWWTGVGALTALLGGYQLAARFYRGPSHDLERALAGGDAWMARRLGVARLGPPGRATAALLEGAYLMVYPMLPLGAAAVHAYGSRTAVDGYWTAVLTAGFVCYGLLPWLPSRTPRALETSVAGTTRDPLRAANLAVLRFSSGVNTVPSGHAATATATALMVATSGAPPAVGGAFVLLAAAIAVGTVTGRYHFAVDAAGGVLVGAACAWLTV